MAGALPPAECGCFSSSHSHLPRAPPSSLVVVRYSGGSIGHSDGRAHAVARRRGRPTGTARPALPGHHQRPRTLMNRGAPSPPPAQHVVSAGRWFSMICRRTRATVRPSLLLFPSRLLKQHDMHAGHCYPRRLHAGLKIPECGRLASVRRLRYQKQLPQTTIRFGATFDSMRRMDWKEPKGQTG